MAWGANKFLKKLFKPNAISNNELADFISRVPDNEEIVSWNKNKVIWIIACHIFQKQR